MAANKGSFKKGTSGNPGGLTAEQRKARDELRDALAGDAAVVHGALMKLIRRKDPNPQAVMYAHQLLHGKEPEQVNVALGGVSDEVREALAKLSPEDLRAGARDDGSTDE